MQVTREQQLLKAAKGVDIAVVPFSVGPHSTICHHTYRARYRKGKPPTFYCMRCGRRKK